MRKKTDPASVSNTSGIAKKPPAKPRASAVVKYGDTHASTKTSNDDAQAASSQHIAEPVDAFQTMISPAKHNTNTEDSLPSNYSSREPSSTPIENDLLRYLTAHISPPIQASGHATICSRDLTSFEIGANEYLVGVVRLIKNDCPEISKEINVFLGAMQQAFLGLQSTEVQGPKA